MQEWNYRSELKIHYWYVVSEQIQNVSESNALPRYSLPEEVRIIQISSLLMQKWLLIRSVQIRQPESLDLAISEFTEHVGYCVKAPLKRFRTH
jgi:hypothetical protein